MSHFQRVVLMAKFILVILVFIVFLTRVAAPFFAIGETMAIGSADSEFNLAWTFMQEFAYILIVPVFIVTVFLYLMFGSADEELQKERERRGL